MLAVACVRSDHVGAQRARTRDREYALAGSSMLNRLALGSPGMARDHRHRKVAADEPKLDVALVNAFLDMYATPYEEIVIDLDATDAPVHGKQEAGEYHAN